MENRKEFEYDGASNGFAALAVILVSLAVTAYLTCYLIGQNSLWVAGTGMLILVLAYCLKGFIQQEPNEARVMMFFGRYRGTFTRVGFYWANPLLNNKRLSLRARNLDVEPIKVNDKTGNPIMIGLMLVWKLNDTYRAMFEIDSQTMANSSSATNIGSSVNSIMKAFERFVQIQSDAALRQVAGQYAYDDTENTNGEITLRCGGDEINQRLERCLDERLAMAGIEIVEARINYIAYAPEIAAVMLRRQQATAIIMAREKIVEGAVSMVKMALQKLSDENIVDLDDDKKAAMVSNLMVVLCGDDSAQPVINAGTLNS
ncbi:MAG: SPFH domain-containing protein [Prevotella sp.]